MWTGGWILLVVTCCSFSVPVRSKKITLNECWNYGKNVSIPPGPVFRVGDVENLSFEDCGRLNPRDSKKFPPWRVYLRIEGKNYVLEADLLSDQTLITRESFMLLEAFKEGKNVDLLAGDCVNKNDKSKCYAGRGLISQKLLDVKMVKIDYGISLFEIGVWRIEKVKLTPSLRPVCLWNRDKRIDASQTFYFDSYFDVQGLTKVTVLPEDSCYTDRGRNISEWECNLYGNAICSTAPFPHQMLYVERAGRFYLRASFPFTYGTQTELWHDILPFTNRIILASEDLTVFPAILESIATIDFGAGHSFPGCGQKPVVEDGRHPWLASLSRLDHSVNEFCGAMLISEHAVVTAAHCLFNPDGDKLKAGDLIVEFGLHGSPKLDSRQNFSASAVVVHPGYNHTKGDHKDDVALIIFERQVNFTEHVAPICLWNSDYDLDKISNKNGTVVGLSSNPHSLQVVSYTECYESNRRFFSRHLRPKENFCAGFPQNRSGSCDGDNGGAFVVENQGRFFLRGVANQVGQKCDAKHYSLYTDLTYFIKWIVENTPDVRV